MTTFHLKLNKEKISPLIFLTVRTGSRSVVWLSFYRINITRRHLKIQSPNYASRKEQMPLCVLSQHLFFKFMHYSFALFLYFFFLKNFTLFLLTFTISFGIYSVRSDVFIPIYFSCLCQSRILKWYDRRINKCFVKLLQINLTL